jgi:diketogulonate reductase-like aldo/keto reductase
MKTEKIHQLDIPKIGFGMWRIGGEITAAPDLELASKTALHSALDLGYTLFDTAEYYAAGHCEELLGEVIRESRVERERLFITSKVSPEHLEYRSVLQSCENSLQRLGMDYLDLYLIHWPNPKLDLAETFRALNHLVINGKVKHLGVSNFNLKLLKKACEYSETALLTNQVPYNLPQDKYVQNGVLDFCQENDTLLTAYSPLRFRDLNVNHTLRAIAEVHQATPPQIAIAWLVAQPKVITIPMSYNPAHQAKNLEAANIELSPSEMESLTNLYTRKSSLPE